MNRTARDKIEAVLLAAMPGNLHSLNEDWIPVIGRYKDGNFGFSYLGLMLYANGHNIHSVSTHHPRGLIFKNENAIFGVGVFFRDSKPNIHIIAPRGKNWQTAIEEFSRKIEARVPAVNLYVRCLSEEQYYHLRPNTNLERILQKRGEQVPLRSRWDMIEQAPWIERAPQEDETFNHRLIDLSAILEEGGRGFFRNVEELSSNLRSMARRACNRFANFLERNDLEFVLEPYTRVHHDAARHIVSTHFQTLEESGKAIGSSAADYENIITTFPKKAGEDTLEMRIGFLQKKDGSRRVPVSFFAYEYIGKHAEGAAYGG